MGSRHLSSLSSSICFKYRSIALLLSVENKSKAKSISIKLSGKPKETITEEMLRDVYGIVADVHCDCQDTPTISPIRSLKDDLKYKAIVYLY